MNTEHLHKLPLPPPEVGELLPCADVSVLAPKFRDALVGRVFPKLIDRGWQPYVIETYRSEARVAYLFGFGRIYDDGRGIVTNVKTGVKGWHLFRLAADLGDRRHDPDHTPPQFYDDLRAIATEEGLTSGDDWDRDGVPVERDPDEHFCDRPHVQWWCDGMHVTPSDHAAALLASGGVEAVWRELHAA